MPRWLHCHWSKQACTAAGSGGLRQQPPVQAEHISAGCRCVSQSADISSVQLRCGSGKPTAVLGCLPDKHAACAACGAPPSAKGAAVTPHSQGAVLMCRSVQVNDAQHPKLPPASLLQDQLHNLYSTIAAVPHRTTAVNKRGAPWAPQLLYQHTHSPLSNTVSK